MRSKKGFTFIEILVIVAIIALLATAIMTFLGESKRRARINSVKTSLRSTLPIIVSCNDYPKSEVGIPSGSEDGRGQICPAKSPNSFWPELPAGYTYPDTDTGYNYNENCSFEIFPNGDRATDIVCNCVKQICQ